jgi:putative redox protein
MTKSVVARWSRGLDFDVDSTDGGAVRLAGDEGVPGYRPMALLLAALAACSGMDVVSILGKKRQPVERYEVRVSGVQGDGHPRTFTSILVEHRFGGTVDDTAIVRAIELSATRYCPVTAHLSMGAAAVRHRFSAVDARGVERSGDVLVTGPHGAGLARRDPD